MQRGFKNKPRIIIAGISLLALSNAFAITLTNSNSAAGNEASMTAALTGSGVTISNMTIVNPGNCTNFRRGVGTFSNGTTGGAGPVLSEPNGVVIANSDLADVAGGGVDALDTSNNNAGNNNTLCDGTTSDPDMVLLEAGTANGEYAVIEFDIVPTASTLAIPFQFGSEEFPEYVCTIYTDIVGIFVSGPGITSSTPVYSSPPSTGTPYENYAKTAAGDLSSINWVNTGIVGSSGGNPALCAAPNGSLANAVYYTDNSNGNATGGNAAVALTNTNLELDGFTNTLFQPITVVAGQTYHVKIAVADTQDRTFDSAAFIHPIFSTGTFAGFDYGDAPDTYDTLTLSGGPSHGVDTSIFMGTVPDNEVTGIPTAGADGDDLDGTDDEDGVSGFPVLLNNATSYSVDVNVTNNSGSNATLVGWIDFDGSGTYESSEGTQTVVANGTTGATVSLNWSGLSGLVNGNTYARIRFSTDANLSTLTPGSAMSDGEVEDYTLAIAGVTFTKYVSTDPVCSDTLQTLTLSVGANVYYCYTVTNPNATGFTITASSDDQGHDISALEVVYAAAASNTVIIGPLTAGGAALPTGLTTVNNASVTADIGGSSVAVNDSASLTVSLTPPAAGKKRLYFNGATNDDPADLTRDPTDSIADVTFANIRKNNDTLTLNQGIAFTSSFTITDIPANADPPAAVQLRIRRRSNRATSVQVELFNGNTGTPIGSPVSSAITSAQNAWDTLLLPITVPADVTLNPGDFIQLVITNTSTGGGARNIQVRTEEDLGGGNIVKSQVMLESDTVISVDNIQVFENPWPDMTMFSSYAPPTPSTVSIRATTSDPFGSADITGATIDIDSPTVNRVTNGVMTSVDSTAGTRTFEYIYDLTTNPEDGFWTLSVTANEGYEAEVFHIDVATMVQGLPAITISKNSAVLSDPVNAVNPKAIPSAIVEYTIGVENSGFGYVDLDSTILTDPLAPNTTYYFGSPLNPATFIDGATSSGLTFTFIDLASTVDDIDFSNDNGATYITPTVDANGFDTTSPPINFIRISPKGEFNGSDGVNNPSMQINFRVRLE